MPELPEVETVLRTLESQIKNLTVEDVNVIYAPVVGMDPLVFKKRVVHQSFRNFKRRGKYLLFEMDDLTLVSHLRMEGKYYIQSPDVPFDKHVHVIFSLSDGRQLRYHDVRKFGRFEIIEKEDEYLDFHNLGPEPFSDRLSDDYLKEKFSRCDKPMKSVLLDQNVIAGIGNIYADEILYDCRIHPLTKASELSSIKRKRIIESTRRILSSAIQAGGTTIRSYTSSLGVTGLFQLNLNVHTMSECKRCKHKIAKIKVGGRGTYYCGYCQRKNT